MALEGTVSLRLSQLLLLGGGGTWGPRAGEPAARTTAVLAALGSRAVPQVQGAARPAEGSSGWEAESLGPSSARGSGSMDQTLLQGLKLGARDRPGPRWQLKGGGWSQCPGGVQPWGEGL